MSKFSSKFNALTATIKALFEELHVLPTEPALYYEDDEPVVGTRVYTDLGPAPSGDYPTPDFIYVVVDGIITAINPAPVAEPAQEPVEELACKSRLEAEVVEPAEPAEVPAQEADVRKFDEEIDALYAVIDELRVLITKLDERISKIESAPAAEMPEAPKADFSALEGLDKVRAVFKRSSF